jgi:hypothetical protein
MSASGLLESFDFPNARLERQQEFTLRLPPSESRSDVKFSKLLQQSLVERDFHGVDLSYLNALKSPLAERLHVDLAKKDGEKKTCAEALPASPSRPKGLSTSSSTCSAATSPAGWSPTTSRRRWLVSVRQTALGSSRVNSPAVSGLRHGQTTRDAEVRLEAVDG